MIQITRSFFKRDDAGHKQAPVNKCRIKAESIEKRTPDKQVPVKKRCRIKNEKAAGVLAASKKKPGLRVVQEHPELRLDVRRYLVIPGFG